MTLKLALIGLAVLGLQACSTMKSYDDTPYKTRTAGDGEVTTVINDMNENIFAQDQSMPAPSCREDYWREQAMSFKRKAEGWYNQAQMEQEKNRRLAEQYQGCLRK
jgi:hypothetical protein